MSKLPIDNSNIKSFEKTDSILKFKKFGSFSQGRKKNIEQFLNYTAFTNQHAKSFKIDQIEA